MKQINNKLYIISESEIEFKNKKNIERARSTCPACKDKREHPEDTSVSWNLALGVGYCFHCGARFKIDNHPDTFCQTYGTRHHDIERDNDFASHLLPMEEETEKYLKDRAIDVDVAKQAGICSRRTFTDGTWKHWVAFPFLCNCQLVNVQYKLADMTHKEFNFEIGGQLVPWNIDCISRDCGNAPLLVTEGMMDALALLQCGYPYVISVPNGAGSNMSCFNSFRDAISHKFGVIIFAGDTDAKGVELRKNFCGYFRDCDVCVVKWKYGKVEKKDANDMLMECGIDGVKSCVAAATAGCCPDVTVMGDDDTEIDQLYATGMPTGNCIGLPALDDILLYQPGNLLLVTGYPGSGKSSLVNFIVVSLLRFYGWRTLFFSPEKMPRKYHEKELISLFTGKCFDKNYMSRSDFEYGKRVLRDNVMFLREDVSDVDDIIAAARSCVRTHNIKVLVIDPFVYLDIPAIPGASETQKVAEVLKKLMHATRELDLQTILVAHPRKPSSDAPATPSLYEVSGSANFYNFCDAGIILERLEGSNNVVRITCGKARREYNGQVGTCQIAYDGTCGRYVSCIKDDRGRYTTEFGKFDTERWSLEENFSIPSLF